MPENPITQQSIPLPNYMQPPVPAAPVTPTVPSGLNITQGNTLMPTAPVTTPAPIAPEKIAPPVVKESAPVTPIPGAMTQAQAQASLEATQAANQALAAKTPTPTPIPAPTPTPIPTPTPTPITTPTPQGIDTTTTAGQIQWYNQDSAGYKDWAKSQGISDMDVNNIGRQAVQAKTDQISADITDKLNQFQQGTYPLTPEQQSQLDVTKQQFDSLIAQQKLTNQSYENGTRILGQVTGRAEYFPDIAMGEVQAAINSGIGKVADLTSKETSALANMKMGFETDNFNLVKESYSILNGIQKDKTDVLKEVHDEIQTQKDKEQTQQNKIDDDIYNRVTKPIQDVSLAAAKNNAPKDIKDAINSAKTVDEAIATASQWLQEGTGTVGEYLYYKRNTTNPVDFNTYQNIDANRKATAVAVASGAYKEGADPSVDAWATRIQNGQAKITDIPASQAGLRNQVIVALQSMGNSADGKPTTTEMGKAALQEAENLMAKFDARKGTVAVGGSRFWGAGGLTSLIPGTEGYDFANTFQTIKDKLSLEAVKYLKGQGQVSDAERALLANAVTKLNLKQSEGEFKTTLQGVIDKLKGNVDSTGNDVQKQMDAVDNFTSSSQENNDLANQFKAMYPNSNKTDFYNYLSSHNQI